MGFHILIIEDNDMLRDLNSHALRVFSDNIVTFRDGQNALDYLERHPAPHLIILDVNLPGISGIDLMKHIRLRLNMDKVKIVATTANRIAVENPTLKMANVILQKPIEIGTLVNTCERLLRGVLNVDGAGAEPVKAGV